MTRRHALPAGALLARYERAGVYTDCFAAEIPLEITHARYVEAFYTTWVFKLERLILKLWLRLPSTDDEARRLGEGALERFAAWRVEARVQDQLLLSDVFGNTRSWLMVAPAGDGTRLYFGSAVVARGFAFRALLGFHKLYSRVLLSAAARRLLQMQ